MDGRPKRREKLEVRIRISAETRYQFHRKGKCFKSSLTQKKPIRARRLLMEGNMSKKHPSPGNGKSAPAGRADISGRKKNKVRAGWSKQ